MLVVTEVTQILARRGAHAAELLFLTALATGSLVLEPPTHDDWLRAAELLGTYRDLRLGTVDATVVAAAERLDLATLATLAGAASRSCVRSTRSRSSWCRSGKFSEHNVPTSLVLPVRELRSRTNAQPFRTAAADCASMAPPSLLDSTVPATLALRE